MQSESSPQSQLSRLCELESEDKPVRCSSPEKCAVCLNFKRVNETSSIDSCSHTFCYSCIWEWSKVRAICPLCKQPFTSIQRPRNGYAGEIYETILIRAPTRTQMQDVFEWVNRQDPAAPVIQNPPPQEIFRQMVYMEWLHSIQSIFRIPSQTNSNTTVPALPTRASTSITTDQTSSSTLSPLFRSSQNWSSIVSLDTIQHYLQRYLRQTTSDLCQSTIHSASTRQTVAFRKYIYLNSLYVQLPMTATHNQTRQCSPQWYRENPACLHRLVPFLARELLALLYNDERTIQLLIREILQSIQHNEIKSRRIKRQLAQYLGRHTKHFLHEFYSFAQCPYDVMGFDRYAIYANGSNRQGEIEQLSSSIIDVVDSGDDDDDEEQRQQNDPINLNQIPLPEDNDDVVEILEQQQHRVNELRFILLMDSIHKNINQKNIVEKNTIVVQRTHNPSTSVSSNQQTTTASITRSRSSSSTHSSFCEIIDYVKPIRERTPTFITLTDDEIQHEEQPSIESTTKKRKHRHHSSRHHHRSKKSKKSKHHHHHHHRSTKTYRQSHLSSQDEIITGFNEEIITSLLIQPRKRSISTNSREPYSSVSPQCLPSSVVVSVSSSDNQTESRRLSSLITIPKRQRLSTLTDIEDKSYQDSKRQRED
ncbi:unnamed protein product [Didymodactylos carnosus]|uniref:RING-type E3 ubiquitin transferase n=1 Tax=Didymodactylos carnosus TaxID=1234261 RepID=A0A814RU19_9BILA|nr:unnamed protein product [Didymodactylos carnosus]CAF1138505.1 unnamed protein product [Didymodactylos carnosus]CAF3747530.1 unnamed protein product [Didymodactylos carnosus]CAF3902251.1 unnamed protein product [Didymodactylos carnosus]